MPALRPVFKQLFGCFTPFLRRSETQQCAAQDLTEEKLPDAPVQTEAFGEKKSRKKWRKMSRKSQHGEREEKGGYYKPPALQKPIDEDLQCASSSIAVQLKPKWIVWEKDSEDDDDEVMEEDEEPEVRQEDTSQKKEIDELSDQMMRLSL